jgi:hypothetical protein
VAFIVEDGTGIANANSLASVEEFDAFHGERGNAAAVALSVETKRQLLIKATDYLVRYRNSWVGLPTYLGQGLDWPRTVAVNYALTHLGVPKGVKQCVIELAAIARTAALVPVGTRGKKRVKIGPLDVEYDPAQPTANNFIVASRWLEPYLQRGMFSNGMNVRLVRV